MNSAASSQPSNDKLIKIMEFLDQVEKKASNEKLNPVDQTGWKKQINEIEEKSSEVKI